MRPTEPLTYDRLVRRHQSAREREVAGRQKSLGDALTGSLLRGEALSAAAGTRETFLRQVHGLERQGKRGCAEIDWGIEGERDELDELEDLESSSHAKQKDGAREKGLREWQSRVKERFVRGEDDAFDYASVDRDEGLDGGWLEMEREERWFADEAEDEDKERGNRNLEHSTSSLEGETGVQDF